MAHAPSSSLKVAATPAKPAESRQAGAGAGDRVRCEEERKRGRRGGGPGARQPEAGAGQDQRPHADAVDQVADRQRDRHGHPRKHGPGLAHGADRGTQVAPDLHEERSEHHDRGLGGDRREDQRHQASCARR